MCYQWLSLDYGSIDDTYFLCYGFQLYSVKIQKAICSATPLKNYRKQMFKKKKSEEEEWDRT